MTLLQLTALVVAVAPADTLRYAVLIQGNPAGTQVTIRASSTTSVILFDFNDRGRGPSTETRVTLGAGGVPTRIEISGNNYLKQTVDERFELDGDGARWSSDAERGESAPNGFFLPLEAAPELSAMLARALLLAPTQRLQLLPAGDASLEDQRVRRPPSADQGWPGLTLYGINGLGFTPSYVWLDDAGDLFAIVSGWQSVVREGFESAVPTLSAAQDELNRRRNRELAAQVGERPDRPVVIRNVAVFDAPQARLTRGQTVVLEGNRISAVGPSQSIAIPPDARLIEGFGKTLLPGFWDMHAHVGGVDGPLNIGNGITSVRDLANDVDQLLAAKKAVDEGDAVGPRIIMAGFIDGPGPYAGPTKALVANRDQAYEWVDRYAKLGYEQIKLYSSLDTALVSIIAERAHAKGLRLSGHIPRGMLARTAVLAGYDEIQHTNMLFLNFLGDTLDTRTPVRFTEVARRGADLDLASDSVQAFVQFLRERGTVVDPTVAIFERMFLGEPGQLGAGERPYAHRLPSQVRRGLTGGGLPADGPTRARYRASFDRMLEMVKALHDAGITIVAGTDCLAGFCYHRELELYGQAGIPNADVLRIATWNGASVAGRTDRLGSIERGKLADLVLVEGDPVADLAAVRNVVLVVKDGVLYDPVPLLAALGIRDWR